MVKSLTFFGMFYGVLKLLETSLMLTQHYQAL